MTNNVGNVRQGYLDRKSLRNKKPRGIVWKGKLKHQV